MVETDWKEILSLSQQDLVQADKDKLCESLSWMEADDIELNFTDLKTLFRLAQDILKYKSEQVNNLMGELEKANRKASKIKHKNTLAESPIRTSDANLETITLQEEAIKRNKKILQKLYSEIAELEERSKKHKNHRVDAEKDSDSSRDPISEVNVTVQLENQIYEKNRHIRKLLTDVKKLEEVNVHLKEKLTQLKDKLKEATQIIENLTEQLFSINSERNQLKEALGKCEQMKSSLLAEMESLKKEILLKDTSKEDTQLEIQSKLQHLKNLLKSQKSEIDRLSAENIELKKNLTVVPKPNITPKKEDNKIPIKMKELEDKLVEASNEIEQSAKLIQLLKTENKRLMNIINDIPEISVHDNNNESDDGKERNLITKLRAKLKIVTMNLQATEALLVTREKELAEIATQLKLVQSNEGINVLLNRLKNKKSQLKVKNDGIKHLVIEVNNLNQLIDDLQLENETLRQEFNIPPEQKIPVQRTVKKYQDMEKSLLQITNKLRESENNLVTVEIDNHNKIREIRKLNMFLNNLGYDNNRINEILIEYADDDETFKETTKISPETTEVVQISATVTSSIEDPELQKLIEENEGLRIGLKEILDFLKDNSTTSSGILALKCPSLETICNAMDARHAAGWFGSHMTSVMELKAAEGSKDALLVALHESRKETFEIMTQLAKESKKTLQLEQKLLEVESKENTSEQENPDVYDFEMWIRDDNTNNIDFNNKPQVQKLATKVNIQYDNLYKKCLHYFQSKFKVLHDNLTSLTVTAVDNLNKWAVTEENYKAQIENLKTQLQQNADDDTSIQSPGLLSSPDVAGLQRKLIYLEESYKHIRTQHENLKNEFSDCKREAMSMVSDYEIKIQNLMICNIDLTDKFRHYIPAELFWKQNVALNEFITKYRNSSEVLIKINIGKNDFLKKLQEDKLYILDYLRQTQTDTSHINNNEEEKVEKSILETQLQQLNSELVKKDSLIEVLNKKNEQLQTRSAKIIDTKLAGTKEDKDDNFVKQQLYELRDENNLIKKENQKLQNQLDITLLKLNDFQQQKDNRDIEINLLRHQILDLQSAGDNQVIIARLSREILISQLQLSEKNKTIIRLTQEIIKEKHMRADAEDMFKTRQDVFNYYVSSYENKFRHMFEILQCFRQEYQGSLPLCTIESYLAHVEELNHKTFAANEKLDEIEDLRLNLMTKHSVYNQILETSNRKSLENLNTYEHNLENVVKYKIQKQELDLSYKKLDALEQSRKKLIERCNVLEQKLILINQGHNFLSAKCNTNIKSNVINIDKHSSCSSMELENIPSDDEASTSSKKNLTFTLPESKFITSSQKDLQNDLNVPLSTDHGKTLNQNEQTHMRCRPELVNVQTQTFSLNEKQSISKVLTSICVQTEEDNRIKEMQCHIKDITIDSKKKDEEADKLMKEIQHINDKLSIVNEQKCMLESTVQNLTESHIEKDRLVNTLQSNVVNLRKQIDDFNSNQYAKTLQENNLSQEENRKLLLTLKELEKEKDSVIMEYKQLLGKERDDNSKTVKDLQAKLSAVQTELNRRGPTTDISKRDIIKEAVSKYVLKITELDDQCFKLQSDLNGYKSEVISCQTELARWKDLAAERLSKMEQLSAQLKERHNAEVESYKAENQHWLTQLNDTQREHMELRSRLSEQKALYIKQLADKETHIEQLRTVVQNLKTQIINMQTMLSINDPSFDLSAIVEVEEASDAVSPQGSERLELKFESVVDLENFQEDYMKMPTTSTTIWQEPLIERLRREKHLISKQNAILRRQIKATAARERRARLDAQNLKNQVFRITTSGSKVATVESAALQNKIASLQAQLTCARRDAHSTVAIWDKWKRAQQAAEKWQTRYEEKCQDEKKLESSLNLTKSALSRLEKEKRVLLSRLSELKSETRSTTEKQDDERSEKGSRSQSDYLYSPTPPVSTRALLDRIQAQQRRIAALEVAEKGNAPLVSEYEKALAEITSLKGQVLKLESTLLESQIRTPLNPSDDPKPELDYWKSYCDMLKEENMQLTLRVNSLETMPTSAHQQRVNDLEQTVLTLRGLVSKLQADQKSGTTPKRVDSRPGSGRSTTEKVRNQIDTYRTEISNLKRTIHEKDLLLEKSKEMLKIAAEREDELLKENLLLRRRYDELVERKGGFLSA